MARIPAGIAEGHQPAELHIPVVAARLREQLLLLLEVHPIILLLGDKPGATLGLNDLARRRRHIGTLRPGREFGDRPSLQEVKQQPLCPFAWQTGNAHQLLPMLPTAIGHKNTVRAPGLFEPAQHHPRLVGAAGGEPVGSSLRERETVESRGRSGGALHGYPSRPSVSNMSTKRSSKKPSGHDSRNSPSRSSRISRTTLPDATGST